MRGSKHHLLPILALLLLFGCAEDNPVATEMATPAYESELGEEFATAKKGGSITEAVTGSTDTGETFEGVLTITGFAVQDGELVAVGTLTGTLTDALGDIIGDVIALAVAILITEIDGTCEILHLELGPVFLDLLGLVVELNQVVLDITAEAGAGNLLGNLLCAVTHLLDGPAALIAIANLLSNILGALA